MGFQNGSNLNPKPNMNPKAYPGRNPHPRPILNSTLVKIPAGDRWIIGFGWPEKS